MGKVSPTGRMKRILWTAAGVVVLAAVIFAGGALSKPRTTTPPVSSRPSATERADEYANQAASTLASNDATAAVELAEQALALDGANATALRVIASVKAADARKNEAAETSAASPPDDSAYREKAESLRALLPASIDGWSAGAVAEQDTEALVTFEPTKGDTDYGKVTRAVFTVHDRGSAKKAEKFVSAVDEKAYSSDSAAVKVGIVPDARFGTDGGGGAVIAFSRGRFAFEIVLVVNQGTPLAELKAAALKLASAWPASR